MAPLDNVSPTAFPTGRRTMLAGLAVLLLAATLFTSPAARAQLESDGTSADDALAISDLLFEGSDHVVVARDDISIDSLAGRFTTATSSTMKTRE